MLHITDTKVTFAFDKILKQSTPSYKKKPLIVFRFEHLCPVTSLVASLELGLQLLVTLIYLSKH